MLRHQNPQKHLQKWRRTDRSDEVVFKIPDFFFYPRSYVLGNVDEASQFANAWCFHKLVTISSRVSILYLLLVGCTTAEQHKSCRPPSCGSPAYIITVLWKSQWMLPRTTEKQDNWQDTSALCLKTLYYYGAFGVCLRGSKTLRDFWWWDSRTGPKWRWVSTALPCWDLLCHTILYHLNKAYLNINLASVAWQGGRTGKKSAGLVLNQPRGVFSTMPEGSPDWLFWLCYIKKMYYSWDSVPICLSYGWTRK